MGLGPGDEIRVTRWWADHPHGGRRACRAPATGDQLAAGTLTGLYEPGYLDHLRDEWRDCRRREHS